MNRAGRDRTVRLSGASTNSCRRSHRPTRDHPSCPSTNCFPPGRTQIWISRPSCVWYDRRAEVPKSDPSVSRTLHVSAIVPRGGSTIRSHGGRSGPSETRVRVLSPATRQVLPLGIAPSFVGHGTTCPICWFFRPSDAKDKDATTTPRTRIDKRTTVARRIAFFTRLVVASNRPVVKRRYDRKLGSAGARS
jgi:hypothetical protein